MTSNERSWSDVVSEAAKGAWLGAESAAIIAASPAGPLQDSNIQFADAVANAAVQTLADGSEALSSAVEARGLREQAAEESDVNREPDTSLTVEPPSWLNDPTEFEADIGNDLAASWESDSDTEGDLGDSLR